MDQVVLEICDRISVGDIIRKTNKLIGDSQNCNQFIIDFSNCNFIEPSSLLVLTCALIQMKKLYKYTVRQAVCEDLNTYIARMNFYKLLGIDYHEHFYRHDEIGRFGSMENFCSGSGNHIELCDNACQILKEKFCLPDKLYYGTSWALNELLDNINEHANSQIGGLFCVQPIGGKVHMCIVDHGIGIPTSLRKNPLYSAETDKSCLCLSLDKEVSDGNGQGNGLYYTRRLVEENGGIMIVRSGSSVVRIKNKEMNVTTNDLCNWAGTIITVLLETNRDIDINSMFEGDYVPTEYEDDTDIIDNKRYLW